MPVVKTNFSLKNGELYKPYRALFQDGNSHHFSCHTIFTAVTVFCKNNEVKQCPQLLTSSGV